MIVSLDDYQSLKEMAYLVRSPENACRLLASIDRLEYRLVYRIVEDESRIAACRYHYSR